MIRSEIREAQTIVKSFNKNVINRISHLDFLKFIAMSLICFGHVMQRWYYNGFVNQLGFAFLYSSALGIFFFVGGFLVKKPNTLKELIIYLVRLVVTYLVPAWIFTCMSIWLLPRFAEHDFGYWMQQLYLNTDTFYWYFLVAAFINAILAIAHYLSKKILKRESLQMDIVKALLIALVLFSYALVFVYIYNEPELGPKCLGAEMVLYYLPIAYTGSLVFIFYKYLKKLKHGFVYATCFFAISLSCYILALYYYQNWFETLNGSFFDILWHTLGSLAGVLCYFYVAKILCKFRYVQKVSIIGFYSGPFYLIHVFLIRLIYTYCPRPDVFDASSTLFVFLFMIVFYLGSISLTVLLVECPITDILLFIDYRKIKKMKSHFKKTTPID